MVRSFVRSGLVVCAVILTLLSPSAVEAQPGGAGGADRRIVSLSIGEPDPTGAAEECLIWEIKAGNVSSAPEDHSVEIVVLIDGTQVASTTQTAIQQFATECTLGVGCGTGSCGSWSTGIELVEAFCREEGSGTSVDCFCGPLFVTPLPPISPQPGDEITVMMFPASGSLPDPDASNDTWTWIFDGPVPGPNRSVQAVEVVPSPTGGSMVRVDVHHESGPTAVPIPFGTEIEAFVNGVAVTSVQYPYKLDADLSSCDGALACITPDGCALWTPPATPAVAGTCLFSNGQQQCACTLAWQGEVPIPGLVPGDELTIRLRPIPGSVPDLPGLTADDEILTIIPLPATSNRRLGTLATRPGSTPGSVIVTAYWEGLVDPSTMTQDLTADLELSVNGVVRQTVTAIALSLGASDCTVSGSCSGGQCGSWDNGVLVGDGTCRDTSMSPGVTDCACGFWFATEFPEETIAAGDQISLVLTPAPGSQPDSNTTDDFFSLTYDGGTVAPNRRIAALSRSDNPSGGTDLDFEIVLERGPSSVPLDLSFAVEIYNSNSLGTAEIEFVEVATGSESLTSCDGPLACGSPPDGCALWTIAQVPVGGTCQFSPSQQNCLCSYSIAYVFDAVPIDPDEGVIIVLRPLPGALPELPGFPDDEEEVDPTTAENDFVRGDCNADGGYDIGDAIALLAELFSSGAPGPCADACDSNDDGGKDIGDAVYILASLFSSGPFPGDPVTACGLDPTPDALDCASFPPCD